MKLILANNQSAKFTEFYADMRRASNDGIDYSSYASLLFNFYANPDQPVQVTDVKTGKSLTDYDGVYINGYLSTIELATATALSCQFLQVPFVNKELANAPSYSKLTAHVKLAAAGVPFPRTVAGARAALLAADEAVFDGLFPAVLKRADADRGIDNFKVSSLDEARTLLADHDDRSLWILQAYVENDGYYVISYYNEQPEFSIFRSLQERPDGNAQKAHMYKPKGGANAELLQIADLPKTLLDTATKSMRAMNRQIGSVDCLYNSQTDQVQVLEVNYNPQLVTIETFKEVRMQAFLDSLKREW